MSARNGKDAARSESREIAVLEHCLSRELGVIPDDKGDWLSLDALASILRYEPRTMSSKITALRESGHDIPRHPFGVFYRLSDISEAVNGEEELKKGKR